jgi:uncharacterized protein YkwD
MRSIAWMLLAGVLAACSGIITRAGDETPAGDAGAANGADGSSRTSDAGRLPDPAHLADAAPGPDAPRPPDAAPPADAILPDAAGPVDATPGGDYTAQEIDLFGALNAARQANGLPPVGLDPKLTCAERQHALDVGPTGDCGHVGTDGSWPWDRAQACGFPQDDWTVNEIAAGPGFTGGADAVSGWRQSSGHWAAIVHPEATLVGVAVYESCYFALFDCCVAGS